MFNSSSRRAGLRGSGRPTQTYAALLSGLCVATLGVLCSQDAAGLDYAVTDPELKIVRIDSAPTESFLGVRADSKGRLFIGGREALFVYEPDNKGGYKPRQQLCKFPNHSWVSDIEIRGNDLYVATVGALYRIPNGVVKRKGLRAQRLVWGVPPVHVHQCFHALAWGPEGDLYFSMGDPLTSYGDFSRPDHWAHWTFFSQPEGTQTPYTGVGGVFRCRPDGSGLQVVAGGLRNSCGLAFDGRWNLFTNDNDHEAIPAAYVPGRLLHVTPHADFAWPRGWMPHKTPDRADLLETMFTGMGRAVPVGQSYYDDVFLPARYRDNLLLARWGIRAVTRYPVRPRGASFQADEHVLLAGRDQARPVGVCVGRAGRIFVTICYMAHNEASPTYQSDLVMITRADDPPGHPFEPFDPTTASLKALLADLSSLSGSRRRAAHRELLDRGAPAFLEAFQRLAHVDPADPATAHLIWLSAAIAGQPLRTPEPERRVHDRLCELARHEDARIRLQVVRALAEFFPRTKGSPAVFTAALGDADPQVVLAALTAFFRLPDGLPVTLVLAPARGEDTYLRQTATRLLAEKASLGQLEELCRSRDGATRLAGVLAAGFRLTLPPATQPLPASLPLTLFPNKEAYLVEYADGRVDLREYGRLGNFTLAEHWKAGKHSEEQEQLFALLRRMLDDREERVRLQAAHFLFLLNDPRSEPGVAKVRTASEVQRLATAHIHGVAKVWVAGPFPDGKGGLATVHPVEQGPIDLAARYDVGGVKRSWKEVAASGYCDLRKTFGPCDHSSFYTFVRLESAERQRALLLVGSDDGVKVWHNGREVWSNPVVRGALPYQDVVPVELQPGSNDFLVRVHNVTGECGLYLNYRALGRVVARLPEKEGTATLAERLRNSGPEPTKIGREFLEVDWDQAAARGEAAKGRQLFGSLGCAKCHAITNDATVSGGPSLADARKRFTPAYLVESILLPSKQVSPVFRATYLATERGQVFTGLVLNETAEKIELLLSDTTRKTIAKKDLTERHQLEISPMPQGLVKTPAELRDLLAYLLSDNPLPP
jgi:putative heme-binding domain-containing protein